MLATVNDSALMCERYATFNVPALAVLVPEKRFKNNAAQFWPFTATKQLPGHCCTGKRSSDALRSKDVLASHAI